MSNGVIYILTNASFPEYVKIGYSKDLEKRMNQLNRSETIPFAFRAYAIYEVESNLTDLVLHDSIEAVVVDDRHVSYKGVTTSTSALAQQLLESEYSVHGTAYFKYENEKLTERRDRMEAE